MITTDLYWEVEGVPLQTLAYNITTIGGTKMQPPPLRGDDLLIPYRHGQTYVQRKADSRTITLEMWVIGCDADGFIPANKEIRRQFEQNFRMLRKLLWNPNRTVKLTKRWKDWDTGAILTATADVVYEDGFAPVMTGGGRATFTVDLKLPDPFFYGPEETVNFAASTTADASPVIKGDWETTKLTMLFNGARTNPRLTNRTENIYVNLQHTLASGNSILLDVDKFLATKNPSSSPSNVINDVSQFGDPFWMVLRPGTQALRLSSSSGTGSGVLKYIPRYL